MPGQEMCGSGRDDELWVVELLQRPGADPEVERVRDVGVSAGVVDEEADANLKKREVIVSLSRDVNETA